MGEETLGLRSLGAGAVLDGSAMSVWLEGRSVDEGEDVFQQRETEKERKKEGKEQERSAVGA
jgi:hypothetical protein